MHEFATAQSIIKTIERVKKENDVKVIHRLTLKIGELTFLSPNQLTFWLKEGLKELNGKEVEIEINPIPPKVKCLDCHYEGPLKIRSPLPIFTCPNCSGINLKVIEGKECQIESIEVD